METESRKIILGWRFEISHLDKERMNRSRNIFCIFRRIGFEIFRYRPIIAIGWIFQRYKDCIFFLRTSINCIGEVSIAILCIEKVDSVVGILFIISPLRFEEERGVDSRRRRDKMEEVREKKCVGRRGRKEDKKLWRSGKVKNGESNIALKEFDKSGSPW